MNIKSVEITDKGYPSLLREIQGPPKILYYIGDLALTEKPCVSVVGTRKPTAYGRSIGEKLGERLGESGVCVVSGMARGIDSYAHRGALSCGGQTIAVLGCGPDFCYPRGSEALMKNIGEQGLILSEYPPGTRPTGFTFPARNRIISGLSLATVIVEAGLKSGSLITAERAAEQGRLVYSVPGNINNVNNIGSNKLIRDGAIPLVLIDDILDDLNLSKKTKSFREHGLGSSEIKILEVIALEGETSLDVLAIKSGFQVGIVAGLVTVLEMKGLLIYEMGKVFIANP